MVFPFRLEINPRDDKRKQTSLNSIFPNGKFCSMHKFEYSSVSLPLYLSPHHLGPNSENEIQLYLKKIHLDI